MKLLQINTTVNTGSTGRLTEEIGQILQEQGHESYIAYKNAGPNGSRSKTIQIGNKLDIYMHGVKTRLMDRHGFGSKRATRNLVEEIIRIDPDVIGLHNLHGYYLNVEVLFNYLKKVQKPVVWTFHDCWPFTGHCSYFDYAACEKWKTECHDCPLSDKYPGSWLADNSRENYHQKKELFNGLENLTIVTPCHWLKNLVGQSFLSGYPLKVIRYGIDLDLFKPVNAEAIKSQYNLRGKNILLGVASVWDRRKGFKYFIELGKRLDDSFKLVLIGLPEKKIGALPENIIGIPRTENIEELVAFYSAADVFINLTLADNFPFTNLEALACGTPVITFDTGGSPEAIDENTGLVAARGNIDDLYKSILTLCNEDLSKYRESCRNRSLASFDKNDRYRDYLNLYKQVQ